MENPNPIPAKIELDVDGMADHKHNIIYIGKATKMEDGTWRCLANVGGSLCLVEVNIVLMAGANLCDKCFGPVKTASEAKPKFVPPPGEFSGCRCLHCPEREGTGECSCCAERRAEEKNPGPDPFV